MQGRPAKQQEFIIFKTLCIYIDTQTDTTVYFTHLKDLIHMQATLANKVANYNITLSDFPSFVTLSENLDSVLQRTTLNLITAIESLEHYPACRPHTRSKRDLSIN